MREIIFRGKRVDNGEWVYGFYHNETSIESPASKRKRTAHHIYTQNFDVFVKPETVGQYTGEKDKNGKNIFEGDIFLVVPKERSNDGKDHYDYVIFRNGCFCLANAIMFYEFTYGVDNYEVVGNIYDNRELLEVTDD